MIGTLEVSKKSDWTAHIASLVHAYNSTRHETTGHTPFFLMFGREPRLPVDLAFGLDQNESRQPLSKYADELRGRFQQSYDKARETIKTKQGNQKASYDTRIWGATLMCVKIFRLQKRACRIILDYNVDDVQRSMTEMKMMTFYAECSLERLNLCSK